MARIPSQGCVIDRRPLILVAVLWPPLAFAGLSVLVVLVPWILDPSAAVAAAAGGVMMLMLAEHGWRLLREGTRSAPEPPSASSSPSPGIAVAAIVVVLGLWLLWGGAERLPSRLYADDLDYLNAARQPGPLLSYLFRPYNEHLCVATRAVSLLLTRVRTEQLLPCIQGVVALLYAAVVTLLVLVALRLGQSVWAVVGAVVFALAPAHRETLSWFSAAWWLIGPLLFLAAWLAAERRSWVGLAVASTLAAVAVLNYSVSAIGGVVLSVYLIARDAGRCARWRLALPAVAAIGMALVVAIAIGTDVVQRADYGGRPFLSALRPGRSLQYLGSLPADVLLDRGLLGGAAMRTVPRWGRVTVGFALVWLVWLGTHAGAQRHRSAAALGLWLMVFPYALIVPFRAWVLYADFLRWGRYHLWPMLGLSLWLGALAGAVAGRRRWGRAVVFGALVGWLVAVR